MTTPPPTNSSSSASHPAPAPAPAPPSSAPTATLSPEALAFASRIYTAAREGDIALFQQALPAGLPPNMTNEKGDSLIMLSSYHGHAPLVQLLLSHKADPNLLNDRQQSPLAGAVFKNETEVINVLLEGGADPEYGAPSAMEAIVLFKQEERWRSAFEKAAGRGKMRGAHLVAGGAGEGEG